MVKRYPGQRPKIEEVIQKLEEITETLANATGHKSEKGSFTGRKSSEDLIEMDFY